MASAASHAYQGSGSLRLDGQTGYAEVGSVDVGAAFSIAGWFKIDAPLRSGIHTIVATGDGGVPLPGFKVFINSGHGRRQDPLRVGRRHLRRAAGVPGGLRDRGGVAALRRPSCSWALRALRHRVRAPHAPLIVTSTCTLPTSADGPPSAR